MLALQAMRGAWAGIQYCCDALREGTVEVQKIKKTVEGGVADARKLYTEVTGLWGWLQGLFRTKPTSSVAVPNATPAAAQPAAQPVAKKKTRTKDEYHVPTQDEVVQQFIGHLGDWFDNYSTLKAFAEKRYNEVFGKDVIDQKEVLELTQLQAELDAAYPTLSDLMSTAPWQLGPIWSKFREMQDKVKAGQAARQMKERRERAMREARAAKERDDRIDRNVTIFFTLLMVSYFWLLIGIIANV